MTTAARWFLRTFVRAHAPGPRGAALGVVPLSRLEMLGQSCSLENPRASRHRRGFTMIETLIVTAIVAILAAGIATLVDNTLRGQKEFQVRSDLQTECVAAFTAITQDVAVAEECILVGPEGATSGTLLALRTPATAHQFSDRSPKAHWVVYEWEKGSLFRRVLGENEDFDVSRLTSRPSEPGAQNWVSQTLVTHVESFVADANRNGLLRVHLVAGTRACGKPVGAGGETTIALPPTSTQTRLAFGEAMP